MAVAGSNIQIGQTLAERYQVTATLGQGGMGSVYRAIDLEQWGDVVIKTPHPALMKDPDFAARFVREIRSLVQLSHPHIVRVCDVDTHEGLLFAVMQYLPEGSLEERQRPCAPADVLAWLIDIADALDFIHQQGLIHRDVKPSNILFDESGGACLCDFGIAKAVAAADAVDEKGLTGAGTIIGTAEFMAPEMLMPDLYAEEYDERVDQYGLAVTVYSMLADCPPFSGDTAATVAVKLAQTKAPLLHELQPSLPEELSRAVARGLLKKPERRYPDCRGFADAVAKAIGENTGRATNVKAQPSTQSERHPSDPSKPSNEIRVTAVANTLMEQRPSHEPEFPNDESAEFNESFPLDSGSRNHRRQRPLSIIDRLKSRTGIAWSVGAILCLLVAVVAFNSWNAAENGPPHDPLSTNPTIHASLPVFETNAKLFHFDFDTGPRPNFTAFDDAELFEIDTDGPDLRITKSADEGSVNASEWVNAGVQSNFTIDGDFLITIEFSLANFPPAGGDDRMNESLLAVVAADSGTFQIVRYRHGKSNQIESYSIAPVKHVSGVAQNSGVSSGQFRIARTGTTATAFYAAAGSSSFTPIGNATGLSGPVRIRAFAAQGRQSGLRSTTALDVSFDNLVIQAAKISGLVDR
jgi:serine/threonine protein kinase